MIVTCASVRYWQTYRIDSRPISNAYVCKE